MKSLKQFANAFDFEVMKLPLSGADNHYTPWYGLFRDDTGDYVGSGSISERYVPHTSDDVCALVEATQIFLLVRLIYSAISRMGITCLLLQLTTIVLLLWVQRIMFRLVFTLAGLTKNHARNTRHIP